MSSTPLTKKLHLILLVISTSVLLISCDKAENLLLSDSEKLMKDIK